MNNVKPVTREQSNAAEFFSEHFDSVLVGTPNQTGNVAMTCYEGDKEELALIVKPSGYLLYHRPGGHDIVKLYRQTILDRGGPSGV
jgi:hypothetical protein